MATLKAPPGIITKLIFSPGGRQILCASDEGDLQILDGVTGASLGTFKGHSRGINDCAFSPDGMSILSASSDGTLKIWDAGERRELATLSGHSQEVKSCAFSPDEKRIVSASSDGTLRLWDALEYRELAVFPGDGPFVLSAFSPDGRLILSASDLSTHNAREFTLRDAVTGLSLFSLESFSGSPLAYSYSPDGGKIVIARKNGDLLLWDTITGAEYTSRPFAHLHDVVGLDFSPDGRRFVSASIDKSLMVWDTKIRSAVAAGVPLMTFRGHGGNVTACAFFPDGRRILSASEDGTLKIWEAGESGAMNLDVEHLAAALRDPEKVHMDKVSACSFSPDGRRVASGSWSGGAILWDSAAGDPIASLEGHSASVEACQFSPDGKAILTCSFDRTLIVWDAAAGRKRLTLAGHSGAVLDCAFSPDSRRIVSASADKTLRIWEASSGRTLKTLEGHQDEVLSCSYSPGGEMIASASKDKTVRFWEAATGRELGAVDSPGSSCFIWCSFTPDGGRVIIASGWEALELWDLDSRKRLFAVEFAGSKYGYSCSPDGQRLALVSADSSLSVLDANNGQVLAKMKGHSRPIESCGYSPDGGLVASVADDKIMKVWEATSGRALATFNLEDQGMRVAWGTKTASLAAGCKNGAFYILKLENLPLGPNLTRPEVKTLRTWPGGEERELQRRKAGEETRRILGAMLKIGIREKDIEMVAARAGINKSDVGQYCLLLKALIDKLPDSHKIKIKRILGT